MAFKSYSWACASIPDWWTAFCNFMAEIGWTLHDTISADEKVWKTQGESGTRPVFYIWAKRYLTSYVYFKAYLYWDATSHTGAPYAGGSSNYYVSNPTIAADSMVCGDKDIVFVSTNLPYNGGYYSTYFGIIPNPMSSRYTTLTDGVSSGSNVSIPVASSAGYATGMYIQIVGISGEGRDKLTIASIPDSTHIVVSSLPRNYGTGALIGFYPYIAGQCQSDAGTFYCLCHPDDAGLANGNKYFTATSMLTSYSNVHPLSGKRQMVPTFFYQTGCALGFSKNTGPIQVYSSAGDILVTMDDGTFPVVSSVTSATGTSITDATKSWTPDALIGKYVVISNGTAINQVRRITDNDATTITVADVFGVTPDYTSEYKIVDAVYRRNAIGTFKTIETTVPPTP